MASGPLIVDIFTDLRTVFNVIKTKAFHCRNNLYEGRAKSSATNSRLPQFYPRYILNASLHLMVC